MTLRGRVEHGTLVLSNPVGLPDGTDVEVEVRPVAGATQAGLNEPTWGEVFADVAGTVEGLPADMADNHDHYIHGAPKKAQTP